MNEMEILEKMSGMTKEEIDEIDLMLKRKAIVNKSYKLTDLDALIDTVEDICNMYKKGINTTRIAAKYNISIPTVYTILRDNEVM